MAENDNPIEREIVSSRIFHMPREAIYHAFAESKQLGEWWGPHGFRNTIHAIELKSGGRWKYTMHAPDGTEHHNECEFVEIVAPVRVIFNHLKPMHTYRMTMTFDEQERKTKLHWAMLFDSKEECEKVKPFILAANEQNFDRLERHLAHKTGESILTCTSSNEIRVSRYFDAPRDDVFEAWTNADQLSQWWGPDGFSVTTHSFDFKPGGTWQFDMHGPNGHDSTNKIVFNEIKAPERIAYRHGGVPGVDSGLFQTTVTFEKHHGKTYMIMVATFPSAEDRDRVIRDYGGAEGGKQMLQRLGDFVAMQQKTPELAGAK